MRVIIVGGEYFTATGLQFLLIEMNPDIEVLTILQSVSECVEWFGSHPEPDLAFMDIYLVDGPVFSLFERVETTCPVTFTIAYEEYTLRVFEANSIDYLFKPIKETDPQRALEEMKRFSHTEQRVDNQALMTKMMQVLNESQMSYKSHFLIPWRDELIPMSVDEITYIYADNKTSVIVTTDRKEHFADLSLEKMVQELNPRLFFRVNRQYIVTHSVIQSMSVRLGGRLTVTLDIEIPERIVVSKAKNKEFKKWHQGVYDPDTK